MFQRGPRSKAYVAKVLLGTALGLHFGIYFVKPFLLPKPPPAGHNGNISNSRQN